MMAEAVIQALEAGLRREAEAAVPRGGLGRDRRDVGPLKVTARSARSASLETLSTDR